MSSTSITIHDNDAFRVIESHANYDDPSVVDDATGIAIMIGDDVSMWLTVGQWRAMVAAVDIGIDSIPDQQQTRIALMSRARARRAAVSA